MPKVLFIINPVVSHYIASFPLAKAMKKQGFNVFFAGSEGFRKVVEDEDFKYISSEIFVRYYFYSFKSFLGFLIKSSFDNSMIKGRYREFCQRTEEIQNTFRKCQPEIVFVDEHLCSYFFYLKKYNVPLVILNTKLSTKKIFNVPPLNSNDIPTNTLISVLKVEFSWLTYLVKLRKMKWIEKLAFLGKDDEFFQERYCRKNKIDYKNTINRQNAFYIGLKNVPTLILAPRNLEFSHRKDLPNEHCLNLKMERDESKYFTEQYKALINKVKATKDKKVIYCAFGTLSLVAEQRILSFLRKLIDGIIKENNLTLVISLSRISFDLPKYDNLYFFPFLPQLDILKHTDLMITHGGLGSIKECLQAGVPMLVYPSHLGSDQQGNAARVVANGFGLRGDMEKDSEAEIMRKIQILLRQPFRKHREVDSEEKVMEILGKIGVLLPTKILS